MEYLDDIEALEALYDAPGRAARVKVTDRLIPTYRAWIEQARFCVLSTVGPDGTDASPRGDDGPVVQVLDPRTLALPDWRGNQRLDSLRNIVRDGRVSLMFMVAGSKNVVRVNGTAKVTANSGMCTRFDRNGALPRAVIVIAISEVYSQCARALMRAGLWRDGDQSQGLPSVGDMLQDATAGGLDGAEYDRDWPRRAKTTMW